MQYCCRRFEAEVAGDKIEHVELDGESSWCANGCCGGGCFVLTELVFCPWCGKPLSPPRV